MKSVKLNAILNGIKTICSFIFPLITTPYATKILSATNYGKVSTSNSIVSYFVLIANLGIATYVQREAPSIRDNKTDFEEFSAEIFTINVISSVFSYLALGITILLSLKLKSYIYLLLIQSLQIILTTIGADWINQVYEDYMYVTIRYILIQIVSLISLFLFVRTKNDFVIYALIMTLAASGGNLFNIFYIRKYTRLHLTNVKKCFKHLIPILKLFASNVATTIYVSSDITILGLMIGDSAAAIYQLASKIYSIVKSLMFAMLMVTLPRLAYYIGNNNEFEYNRLLRKIFNSIATFIFPCIAGLFMLSPQVILILSTNEFIKGVLALRILCFSIFFATFASIFATAIILLYKRDNVYLFATIVSSAINVLLNFVLIPFISYYGAALTTLIAEALMLFILVYYSRKIENIHDNFVELLGDKKVYIGSIIGGVIVILICKLVIIANFKPIQTVLFSIVLSVVAYLFICLLFKNEIVIDMLKTFKSKLVGFNQKNRV